MTFQNQVQTYTQVIPSTDNLTQWLTDGARILVNVIPERMLERFETALTDSGSGITLTGRFVRASKSGYDAPMVKTNIAGLTDASSIFYANARSPKCYLSGGKAYVVPSGGSVYVVVYPTVLHSAETITLFPTELEPAVVLYAAIRALYSEVKDKITSINAVTLFEAVPPSSPDDTVTIGALPTAPVYTAPTHSYLDDFTVTEARLTADDTELANTELSKLRTQLEQYAREQQDANAEFQEDVAEYQAGLEKLFKQADIDLRTILEKYSLDISRYGQEVNAYAQEVQANLSILGNSIQAITGQINLLKNEYKEIIGAYVTN